ncbi:hypothetical protein BOTBODRAFT_52716 [Botryobasidium botryosum FD-172 SS1]|uniref:WW domain-containing protein n=1 Tax=Botryobasidium botryosum (strain FD-172 SS1) TaxID=930990 RepID=A0A067MT67_BOTB1|nr:hypothetical protein BOTBODRAFT_52716 [Botryobasidium botryosum FD-172 SS1]
MPLPGPPAQTHLPHGVEEKETPDGKRYWIDYRPSKPSWDDPRASSGDPLPPGVERYITPDGVPYFVNRSPRVTWMDPRSRPARPQGKYENASEKSMVSSDLGRDLEGKEDVPRSYLTLPSPGPLPVTAHVEYALLMDLTRWRFAQVLSGYPDARSADVDTIILLLKTRLKVADPSVLEPIEDSYIQACRTLISSEPNLNLFAIPGSKEGTPQGGISELSFWGMLKPTIYFLLLGIPSSYQRRISRADWVQWASSKRWIDQRENFGAFMNSLISEWNLINLISTLFFSATVGFLSINELAMIPAAATLISMMFSMGSLTMSVSLIWRYQRQLTQVTEMRTIMVCHPLHR